MSRYFGIIVLMCSWFYNCSLWSHPVFEAIKTKNVHRLQQEISSFSIDYQDKKNNTALIICAKTGFFEGAKYLLINHANLNLKDHKGRTALHHAIRKNHVKIAQALMNYGASPWDADHNGRTASSFITNFSSNEKIKHSIKQNVLIEEMQLILKRISTNATDEQGSTDKAKINKNNCTVCDDIIDESLLNLCTLCQYNFKSYIEDESTKRLICFPQFRSIPLSIEALFELGFTMKEIETFRINQVKIQLKKFPNIIRCPHKNCENYLELKKGEVLKCNYCNYVGCSCGTLHPIDISCEDVKAFRKQGYRLCPGCLVVCKKAAGCDLITCPNCQEHWRFESGKKETKRNVGLHTFPDYVYTNTWQDYVLMKK